ncbi:MAG TPA: carboxypeptidase regulatory-like domain-containing protein [Blastocatellia bacterium]|nr:carboxypeptidase regulatory-like domain-containing protein [Blastocatellia bacterium]
MMAARLVVSRSISILMLALIVTVSGSGQSTSGSITGTVKDSAGAPIADAGVTITDPATNLTRSLKSNSAGGFTAAQLPPGKYNIAVEKSGFKRLEKTNIILNAIDLVNAGDFVMEVGAVSDTVTVVAESARIEIQSESGERSGVVTGTQLKNLALNGRNYQDFLKTVPGVIPSTVTGSSTASSTGRLGDYSVNGTRANQKELTVDGSSNIDTGNNVDTHASLNPDAIAEVKVLTSNFQAEYGRAGGAFISVVSKSGTSQFHGGARYFHRHEGLNADNYFRNAEGRSANDVERQPRNLYRYNNIGYEIGGPVYLPFLKFNRNKDQLFFYWNQEWYEQLVPEGTRNIRVPTQLERNGNFSQTLDGNGNPIFIRDPSLNLPCNAADRSGCFPNNQIPANRFFESGQAILNLFPLPNTDGGNRYNYTSAVSTQYPRREDILRMDWNISDRTRLTGRFTRNVEKRLLSYGSFASEQNFLLSPISFPRPGRNGVLSLTHTFSPTLTNEFIFGPSSNFIDLRPNDERALASTYNINIPKLFPGIGAGYVPNFRFGGIANINDSGAPASGQGGNTNPSFANTNYNGLPFINVNHTFNFIDNVSKIIGTHTLKAGIYAQRSRKDQTVFARTDGDINFFNDANNPLNSQHPFANALLGIYNSYTQANNFVNGLYRYWNVEWYLQDNWKATRKLTLDYGLRMSWYQPQYDARLQTGVFNPSQFNPAQAPRIYIPVCINGAATCPSGPNRAAVDPAQIVNGQLVPGAQIVEANRIGLFVPGTGDLANGIGQASADYPRGGFDDRGIQWGPRFGFAYDLTGNGKTVIRGGAGISYDRVQGNVAFDQIANPPTVLQPQLLYGRLADITPGQSGLIGPSPVFGYARDGKLPTIYSMSLSVQRDLGFNTVVDVSYVGTLSRHLFQQRNLNAIPFGFLFTRAAQDPSLFPNRIVPDVDPDLPAAYRAAGLAFDGSKALPDNLLKPYPGLTTINFRENTGSSNFNSLQVAVNRRFSRGFTFSGAYTWSKALGTNSGDFDFVNPYNTRLYDYRLLNFDRTHAFTASYVYELPKLGNRFGHSRWSRGLLNGWQISGITSFISGNPFDLGIGVGGGVNLNQRITGSWTEPARLRLNGDPAAGPNGLLINPNAFIIPELGSLGQGERTYLRNPGINNTDLSLFKNFALGDPDKGRMLQFRVEAFNVFNHTQFSGINANTNLSVPGANGGLVSDGTIFNNYGQVSLTNNLRPAGSTRPLGAFFGEYNAARDPRIIQLGMKISW